MKRFEIEGYIVLLGKPIAPFSLVDLQQMVIEDEMVLVDNDSCLFYSYHAKQQIPNRDAYPLLTNIDLQQATGNRTIITRMQRLGLLAHDMLFYQLEYSNSSFQEIESYAKGQKSERLLVFSSYDLVNHYSKLLKIFRLNSFLYNRLTNLELCENLFLNSGYIRKGKLDAVLDGEGRSVSENTFQYIEPVLDVDYAKDVTRIHRVRQGEVEA
ncbi:MAG: hypothetical protein AAF518_26690 [Spirochaetota bacterium]